MKLIFYAIAILIIFVILLLLLFLIRNNEYKKTSYYKSTRNQLLPVMFDKGKYGEYLTYKYLKEYEKSGAKFLFNAYIPKKENENTEIDIILISPQGIFIFESKNYSGWIFGNEKQKTWTQTLQKGKSISKEKFFNPIMQNKSHIKYLVNIIGKDIPIYSIIVFSERCQLKNVQVDSKDVYVVKRNRLVECVTNICDNCAGNIIDQNKIQKIYSELLPLTNVSNAVKQQHIERINKKHNKNSQNEIIFAPSTAKEKAGVTIYKNENIRSNSGIEENDLICPRCSSKLVIRTAKRGENAGKQFYGCSNYPKCRYIKNLDETANGNNSDTI